MPRPERPLDGRGGPVEEFAARLRQLREEAGGPTYRALARKANFSAATLAVAASGRRLPTLDVALAYVRACGGDKGEWEARWRGVAAQIGPRDGRTADGLTDQGRSPYRGLEAFQPEDSQWFFGRQRLVDELLRRLSERRFLTVFGPSGVGKSSVVRAGLLPAVRDGALVGGGRWPTVLMTPGKRPLAELAVRLGTIAGVPAGALLEDLTADPARAHLAIRQALAGAPRQAELLLVVDQFEEVFSICTDEQERAAFIASVLAICQAQDSRARVVLAARADSYMRFADHPELVAALADSHVLVGAMSGVELREAITKPADRAGAIVEGALISTVIAETAGRPGALPLASHALLEAWRRRRGTAMTLAAYVGAGGVDGAVAQTAEGVYKTLSRSQREIARVLLCRMVEIDQEGTVVRRRVLRSELDTIGGGYAVTVLDRLVAARLLTADRTSCEIAHEALIRAWPRLRGWVDEDRDGLRLRRQLTEAVSAWESFDRDEGALHRGARLAAALERAGAWRGSLTPAEQEFLELSAALRDREAAARRHRQRRLLAGLVAAMVIVSALAVTALVQAGRARAERDLAFARRLVADARTQLQVDPELGLLLARRAYQLRASAEAEAVLRQATAESRGVAALTIGQGGVTPIAFAGDGTKLAVVVDRSTIQVREIAGGARLAQLTGGSAPILALASSADGHQIAFVDAGGGVHRWDWRATTGATAVGSHRGAAYAVALSPDGRLVASGGADGTVQVWDVATPGPPTVLRGHTGAVRAVAFSADGRRVASGGADGFLRVWDVRKRGAVAAFQGNGRTTWTVTFSPDGRRVVGGNDDGAARIWSIDTPGPPVVLQTSVRLVRGIAFSPDGGRIATTGTGGVIHLWDAANPVNPLPLRGHTHSGLAVVFTPGGERLISSAADGTVRTWDTAGRADPTILPAPATGSRDIAFSPDGRHLATGGPDGVIRIWGIPPIGTPRLLDARQGRVVGLVFSPDGTRLASGGDEGVIRLWDLSRDTAPILLKGESRTVRPIAFSADGTRFAGASLNATDLDTRLHVWDLAPANQSLAKTLDAPGFGVALSPDGQQIALGNQDGTIALHAIDGTAGPRTLAGHQGPVHGIAYSHDNERMATAGQDGTIRIWDHGADQPRFVLPGHPGGANSVQYTVDNEWLVSTGSDGTTRVWDPDEAADAIVFRNYGPPVRTVTYHPASRLLAATHTDGSVRTWQCEVCGPIDQVIDLSARRATRQMTPTEVHRFLDRT